MEKRNRSFRTDQSEFLATVMERTLINKKVIRRAVTGPLGIISLFLLKLSVSQSKNMTMIKTRTDAKSTPSLGFSASPNGK